MSVFAADVDGDGVTRRAQRISELNDDKIAWYENDGSENFTTHTISTVPPLGPYSVFAADVDGDGDTDVLSASHHDDKIAWYENLNQAYDFSTSTYSSPEGDASNTTNVVMLARTGPTSLATNVDVILTDGTALAGTDFTTGPITVNFDIGETIKPVPIELLGDTVPENDELFGLSLANFSDGGGAGMTHPTAIYYIDDDDFTQGDFGDSPVAYPTTLAENGARHLATGPTLGATRDAEADGTHSAAADADGMDEDGVTFGSMQVGVFNASVTVNVQGGAGLLDAWIDFNVDGSWGGPGEQIFDNVSVSTGDNILTFDVPFLALGGSTYARFRLSTAGDLGVIGLAVDGEVEDYQVAISPPTAAAGAFGGQNTISTAADLTP